MSNPKPIKEQLIDLLNAALAQQGNPTVYVEADLTFGRPVAYDEGTVDTSEPDSFNTSIEVTAGEGLTEVKYRLHYHRYDLAHLASLRPSTINAALATESSTHDVLALINTHYGVPLLADDLEDDLFESVDADSYRVLLNATADSLGVIGSAALVINDTSA